MRGPGFGRSVGTGRNPSTEKPRAALVPSLVTQALLLARPEQWERGLAQTPSLQGQAHDMEACTWPPSSLASLAHILTTALTERLDGFVGVVAARQLCGRKAGSEAGGSRRNSPLGDSARSL